MSSTYTFVKERLYKKTAIKPVKTWKQKVYNTKRITYYCTAPDPTNR